MADQDFIPTRATLAKIKKIEYKCVEFNAYKPKPKSNKYLDVPEVHENQSKENPEDENIFNIKRAKNEVVKFGMTGFSTAKKEEARTQLLIKLGAKPKRNKCKNYKVLKEEKKVENAKLKSKTDFQQLGKNNIGKSTAKKRGFDRKQKKTKRQGSLLEIYGKVKAQVNSKGKA